MDAPSPALGPTTPAVSPPADPPADPGRRRRRARTAAIASAATGLVAGTAALFAGRSGWADGLFIAGIAPVFLLLMIDFVASLRARRFGLDIVAAAAIVSALLVGETLAAAVVALMLAGGQALEAYAEGRAGAAMNALLARVPRTALRYADGRLETVPIDAVRPGDRLLVRQGDVVPADGTVLGPAVLDEAAITGESLPVTRRAGEAVLSGGANVGNAFDLHATRTAADSTFAGIVRLVEEATRAEAPATRLADRFALGFTILTAVLSLAAWWVSGDPVRAVAVLVVATPCPLILAVPVAIVAGLSRAAQRGILVKGGGALEALARVRTLVVDKTGTLTKGAAAVADVRPAPPFAAADLLRLAAALDQASQHAVARALVAAARRDGLDLPPPTDVTETPGEGVEGLVDGRRVRVGGKAYALAGLPPDVAAAARALAPADHLTVAVTVDGAFAGLVLLADVLRPDAADTLARLKALGVARIVLATGDRQAVAAAIAAGLPLDHVAADLDPEAKIALVRAERRNAPVMMVGDGVNDAPALVAADVGVAMGAKGAAASAEAADVVLLADSLGGLVEAVSIARRSRRIALQSVVVGLGLSLAGMVAAAFGLLPPVQGAFLQEAIDVAVILNALRALQGDPLPGGQSRPGA
ncbi:heavy metal translocating P-type ATPase [Mongoliimonas terrestris]|uniref:heavy metal translocating P-type ATPase n=1 Tax=Mongoliimonas terrestris TaxID=1709001 RepID=UPI0009FB933D|nr:heavy metal translocating P-type ATPase [Mongoliimonas terrestris]